jgi:hypothetical protein
MTIALSPEQFDRGDLHVCGEDLVPGRLHDRVEAFWSNVDVAASVGAIASVVIDQPSVAFPI